MTRNNNYAKVWHGTLKKTSGGLTKKDLMKNKRGKIVSKKRHNLAKRNKFLIKAGFVTQRGKFGSFKKAKQTNYSNTLMGIPILGLIMMTLLIIIFYPNNINYYIFLTLNIIFLFLHFGFFNFVKKTKGSLKAFRIIPICYLDTLLMLLSIFYGSILYFMGRKY